MIYFLLLVALIYSYFIFWISQGLRKLASRSIKDNSILHSYSIIIAAHNEEEQLPICLQALVEQNYPLENYEIIVAADRCCDKTVEVARLFQKKFANLHIIELRDSPPGVSPKKNALAHAIQKAAFEHLLFLDADVRPSSNHIAAINRYFDKDTAAVIGLMKFYPPETFWQKFIVFEKLLSWCIAGAGIAKNKPVIAYGGNWGYTKTAFRQVGGFEKIRFSLSGDDDLLLQQMNKCHLPIRFCLDSNGWTLMAAPEGFSHFFRQRRRHFSAGKKYRPGLKWGYLCYHTANLSLWFGWTIYEPALLMLLIKLVADMLIVYQGRGLFQEKCSVSDSIIFNLLYMIYNTLLGPLGHIGKLKW